MSRVRAGALETGVEEAVDSTSQALEDIWEVIEEQSALIEALVDEVTADEDSLYPAEAEAPAGHEVPSEVATGYDQEQGPDEETRR